MRHIGKNLAACVFAMSATIGIAAGQQLPVPPNEIMPRLPPVPDQTQPNPSVAPCRFSTTSIPKGDTKTAARAERTADGIMLYGGKEQPDGLYGGEEPLCPLVR